MLKHKAKKWLALGLSLLIATAPAHAQYQWWWQKYNADKYNTTKSAGASQYKSNPTGNNIQLNASTSSQPAIVVLGASATTQTDVSVSLTNGVTSVGVSSVSNYVATLTNTGTVSAPVSLTWAVTGTGASGTPGTATCSGLTGGATCTGGTSATLTMPAGSTANVTIPVTIGATTGSLSVTATASITDANISDVAPANNVATDTDTVIAATTDVSISVDNGKSVVAPSSTTVHNMVVQNLGSSPVNILVTHNESGYSVASVTCATSGGATCVAGSMTGYLPVGGLITFALTSSVTGGVGGNAQMTGTVSVTTATVVDSNPANDTATDIDTISNDTTDISVTMADSSATIAPAEIRVHTVTVNNTGVKGVYVNLPIQLVTSGGANSSFSSVACSTVTAGSFCNSLTTSQANLYLAAGGQVNFLVRVNGGSATTGAYTLTVGTSTSPMITTTGVDDSNRANDEASDTNTLSANQSDFSIALTTPSAQLPAASTVSYTVTVANNGAYTGGAFVSISVSGASLQSVSSKGCTGASMSGSGASWTINNMVGGGVCSLGVIVSGTSAAGVTTTTGTVTVNSPLIDPNLANNVASHTLANAPAVSDVNLTLVDGVTSILENGSVVYTITINNPGATSADVTLTQSAVASGGASLAGISAPICYSAATNSTCSGSPPYTSRIGPAGNVKYQTTVTAGAGAGALTFTATATPSGVTDPNMANNTASDSNTIKYPSADLSVTATWPASLFLSTDGTATFVISNISSGTAAGTGSGVFSLTATNTASNASFSGLTCTAVSGGGSCSGLNVVLPPSATATYTAKLNGGSTVGGSVMYTGTITPDAGSFTDPNLTNNTVSKTYSKLRQAIYSKSCYFSGTGTGFVGESFHDWFHRTFHNYVASCNVPMATPTGSYNSCFEWKGSPGYGAPNYAWTGVIYPASGGGFAGFGAPCWGQTITGHNPPGACNHLFQVTSAALCNGMGAQGTASVSTAEMIGTLNVNGCAPSKGGVYVNNFHAIGYLSFMENTPGPNCTTPGSVTVGRSGAY